MSTHLIRSTVSLLVLVALACDPGPYEEDTGQESAEADPDETTWFYPGHWFGVDEPVPTVQLKWLRRAQQDYQYLRMAKERGEVLNALVMARLITKPVEMTAMESALDRWVPVR